MYLSSLNNILKEHNLDVDKIANYDRFSLLEQPRPYLCADRIDYAIREFKDWANPQIVESCSSQLVNHKGRIVFSSEEGALKFSYNYMKLQREHWGGAEWILRWQIFSEVLRYALDKEILQKENFFRDDQFVLDILEASSDEEILKRLFLLENKLNFKIDDKKPAYVLHKKFRYIDPSYLDGDRELRLSENNKEYSTFLEREREHNKNGHKISLT